MSKKRERLWMRSRVAKAGMVPSLVEGLEQRLFLATVSWDGGPSGTGTAWSDPVNWAGDVLPGPTDDALINPSAGPTIQIAGVVAIRSVASGQPLAISGSLTVSDASFFSAAVSLTGTLAGTGDCTFAAPLTWSGGVMAGPATTNGPVGRTIINGLGSLQIDGTTHDLNRVLENNGTTTWLGGPLRMSGGTVNNNNVFTANTAGSLQSFGSGGTNAFNNLGSFNKLGTGETAFSILAAGVAFNSLGTVNLQAGTLTLGGGGTMSTPLTVSPGAAFTLGDTYTFTGNGSINGSGTVNFTGGTHSLPAGRFNPTGVVNFTGGTVTIATPFTPSGIGPIGGTVVFSAAMNFSGALTVTGSVSFAVAQTFTSLMLSGTVTGSGDVTVTGLLDWMGGAMSGSGKTFVISSGSLLIETGAAHVLSRILNSGGAATWTGGDLAFAAGTFNNNGTFTANSAGTLLSYGNSGANTFLSNGTFTKLGTGEARFTTNVSGVAFNNLGTVTVAAGKLTLGGGGSGSTAFNVNAAGTLAFAGNYSFQASGSIAGPGTIAFTGGTQVVPAGLFNPTGVVNFTAGTVTINNPFTPTSLGPIGSTLTMTSTLGYSAPISIDGSVSFSLPQTFSGLTLGGTLSGAGDITVTGSLTWNSGSMNGAGKTMLPAGSTLTIGTGATHTLGRQLVNNGDAVWSGGAIAMSNGILVNNGTFTANASTTLQCYGAGGTNAINNAGIFSKQGIGDVIIFAAPSAMPLNNTGLLTVAGGNLSLGGGSTNTGIMVQSGATLTLTAGFTYNAGGGLQGAGTLNFNGGTHTFATGQFSPTGPVNFNGGTVTINNAFSPSVLGPIAGTVILNTSLSLANITLSGTISGSGDITVSGSFTWLGGTMSGTGKTILTAGSTLVFSTNAHNLSRRLDSGGAASWLGGDIAFSGGTLNVLAGTTFTLNTNAAVKMIGSAGVNAVNNAGSIVKLGIGDAQFVPGGTPVALNNTGSITAQQGSFTIGGGGTTSGTIAVPLGGVLNLSAAFGYSGGSISGAGQVTFSGGIHVMTLTNFIPTGTVSFSGGTVTVANAISPTGMGPISGTVIFISSLNFAGALDISGSVTFGVNESLGSMTLSGTLAGVGDVSINGTFTWSGGTMSGTGRTVVLAGSTLVINGSAHTLSRPMEIYSAGSWTDGDIAFSGGSITTHAGSAFTLDPATTVTATGTSGVNAWTNQGTLTKIGAGTARLAAGANGVTIDNSSQIVVQDGVLDLSGGGTNTGTFQSLGTGTLSFGATMTWSGGSISGSGAVTFAGGTHSVTSTQFTPTGAVNFSGGIVTIGNAFTPATLGAIGATATFNAVVNYSGDLTVVGTAGFAAAESFANVTLSGTLAGAGAITVRTALTWTAGTMTGTGSTVLAAGSVNILSGGSHSLSRVLTIAGAAGWTGGDMVFSGGTMNIAAGGVLTADLPTTTSISGLTGTNAINNSGQLVKLGVGTLQLTSSSHGVVFNNYGATQVTTGTLSIGGNGTTTGIITVNVGRSVVLSASFSYAGAGAIVGAGSVTFTGGTHTITSGQLGVTGAVNFTGGAITISGYFAPSSLGTIGANVTFLSTLVYTGALVITGAAAFNNAQSFSAMTLSGTLSGVGDVTVAGLLSWTGGAMTGSGQTIVPVGATLSLTGNARSLSRSLNLSGTATWSAGDMNFTDGTLAILSTGILTVTTTSGITISGVLGSNLLINKGILTKAGTGAFTFASTGSGVTLTNDGTLNAQAGAFNVGPWVSNFTANTLTGGAWVVENVGNLNFPVGTNIYTNNATIRLNGVNSNILGIQSLTTNQGSLTLNDGRLATFTPLGNLFTNFGTLTKSGAGTATFAATITFNNSGTLNVIGGGFTVLGPVSQISGNTLNGGSWNVSAGGVLTISGASITTSNAIISISGATSAFDAVGGLRSSSGSFTVSGGKAFSTPTFTNTGKLTVGLGSTMTVAGAFNNMFYTMLRGGTLNASGGGVSSGLFWFFDGGQIILSGAQSFGAASVFSGNGAMTILGGSSQFFCPVTMTGTLTVSSGTVSFEQGASFGGALNAGTLSLGSQSLTLANAYSQTSTGSLNIRMDSPTAFGRIVSGGVVNLAGTLGVTWGAGYVPAPGISFDFVTGTIRAGAFGVANLAPVAGRLLQLNYTATGVSLLVNSGFLWHAGAEKR